METKRRKNPALASGREEPYVVRTGLFLEGPGGETLRELVFCLDEGGGWLAPWEDSGRVLCQALCLENDGGWIYALTPCGAKPSQHKAISLREAVDRGLLARFYAALNNEHVNLFMFDLLKAAGLRTPKARRAS